MANARKKAAALGYTIKMSKYKLTKTALEKEHRRVDPALYAPIKELCETIVPYEGSLELLDKKGGIVTEISYWYMWKKPLRKDQIKALDKFLKAIKGELYQRRTKRAN